MAGGHLPAPQLLSPARFGVDARCTLQRLQFRSHRRLFLLRSSLLAALLLVLILPTAAMADVPEGSDWKEHYIPAGDVTLHADVFRPKGMADSVKTPVILSIGPYFGHGGQSAPNGDETDYPSTRFDDMIEGGKIFETRLHGRVGRPARLRRRRTGCNDFGGTGEQADVKAAVEWAAVAAVVERQGRHVGQELRRLDAGHGARREAQGPRRRRSSSRRSSTATGRSTRTASTTTRAGTARPASTRRSTPCRRRRHRHPGVLPRRRRRARTPPATRQNIAMQNATRRPDDRRFWEERDLPAARGSRRPDAVVARLPRRQHQARQLPADVWATLKGP